MILHGDCLELMKDIPDGSIDMILCDLPYGTTACKWDTVIPFEPLWEQYERIIKDSGAIVLTSMQPFASALTMSNIKLFKYEWIWNKSKATGFLNAKKQPLRSHENVLVFYKKQPTYNPQMVKGELHHRGQKAQSKQTTVYGNFSFDLYYSDEYYPQTVRFFNVQERAIHPTQKPVALFEYLIKTYTNEGETVLDNCAGSGTTAIACINTNRKYICMEKDETYYKLMCERVKTISYSKTNSHIQIV